MRTGKQKKNSVKLYFIKKSGKTFKRADRTDLYIPLAEQVTRQTTLSYKKLVIRKKHSLYLFSKMSYY